MEWIDICANLTHESFAPDLPEVLARARSANVHWMLVTGASGENSMQCVDLAEKNPECLRATLGVHPHHANTWSEQTGYRFAQEAQNPLVLAIGETGLDFYRNHSTPIEQKRAFSAQLELAIELKLPVFLHERDASHEFGDILERYRGQLPRAVVHCFTSNARALDRYLEMDCHIGITGWVCDERRGKDLQRLVSRIPPERLMIETDAPYLLPRTLPPGTARGRRNEPAFLPHIGGVIAELRGQLPDELALQTAATARDFYQLPGASSSEVNASDRQAQ